MELAGSVRSPSAGLESSECCHMLDLAGASSKCAEQRDSNHELRALAKGVRMGYSQERRSTQLTEEDCVYKSLSVCVCVSIILSTCLFVCPVSD